MVKLFVLFMSTVSIRMFCPHVPLLQKSIKFWGTSLFLSHILEEAIFSNGDFSIMRTLDKAMEWVCPGERLNPFSAGKGASQGSWIEILNPVFGDNSETYSSLFRFKVSRKPLWECNRSIFESLCVTTYGKIIVIIGQMSFGNLFLKNLWSNRIGRIRFECFTSVIISYILSRYDKMRAVKPVW